MSEGSICVDCAIAMARVSRSGSADRFASASATAVNPPNVLISRRSAASCQMQKISPFQATTLVCSSCGWLFADRNSTKVDDVIPCVQGGAHDWANIQTLPRYCHDQQSAYDASLTYSG
jgi:hypothetical protein